MPTVAFEASAAGPAIAIDVPAGGALVDLCDDACAPVHFSCRAATCGTCRVEVLAGMDRLDAPREDERDLLELLGAPRTQRLACQAAALSGPGLIRLRWAGHLP